MNRKDLERAREDELTRVRRFVLRNIQEGERGLARLVIFEVGVQAWHVYGALREMVAQGLLYAEGKTASRRYWLTETGRRKKVELERRMVTTAAGNEVLSDADAELLERKPRTLQEAERRAWLVKRIRRAERS